MHQRFLFSNFTIFLQSGIMSGTIGPDGRKRKSGDMYKKERDEKKKSEDEIIKKSRKIESYFRPKISSGWYTSCLIYEDLLKRKTYFHF